MELDFVAIFLAAVGGYIVGALWYSPLLFMKPWCEASGVNPEDTMTNPVKTYGTTFVLTLIGAIVLAILLGTQPPLLPAIAMSLLLSGGLIATSMGVNGLFNGMPLKLWLIDSGFHVTRFAIMALLISLLS